MLDRVEAPDEYKQMASVQEGLLRGAKVSQVDIKEAVTHANKLREKHNRFDTSELAFALGNFQFHRWSTEERISLEPDAELAEELRKLQKSALIVFSANLRHVPQINCLRAKRPISRKKRY